MDVLASFTFSVQFNEALGAEEVDTIFTKDGSVVVLAFEANKTVDDTL